MLVQLQDTGLHLGELRGHFRPGAKARQTLRNVGAHHVGMPPGDAVGLQNAPQLDVVLPGLGQVVRRQKGACALFRGFQQDGIRVSAALHQQMPGVARREVSFHVDAPGQVVILPGDQAGDGQRPVVKNDHSAPPSRMFRASRSALACSASASRAVRRASTVLDGLGSGIAARSASSSSSARRTAAEPSQR